VIAHPTLLGPVLVWNQQNYERILSTVTYFETSREGCPRNPHVRKSGCENEGMRLFLPILPSLKVFTFQQCMKSRSQRNVKLSHSHTTEIPLSLNITSIWSFTLLCYLQPNLNVRHVYKLAGVYGVGRIFSRGGPVGDFPKIFPRGGPKAVNLVFNPRN